MIPSQELTLLSPPWKNTRMNLFRAFFQTFKPSLWRGVALFMLTFIVSDVGLVDIVFPGHCTEMLLGYEKHAHPPLDEAIDKAHESLTQGTVLQPATPQSQETNSEDGYGCTCVSCCSHVLPPMNFVWPRFEDPLSVFPWQSWLFLTKFLALPFHPPKFVLS